jgi:hypothetical protein
MEEEEEEEEPLLQQHADGAGEDGDDGDVAALGGGSAAGSAGSTDLERFEEQNMQQVEDDNARELREDIEAEDAAKAVAMEQIAREAVEPAGDVAMSDADPKDTLDASATEQHARASPAAALRASPAIGRGGGDGGGSEGGDRGDGGGGGGEGGGEGGGDDGGGGGGDDAERQDPFYFPKMNHVVEPLLKPVTLTVSVQTAALFDLRLDLGLATTPPIGRRFRVVLELVRGGAAQRAGVVVGHVLHTINATPLTLAEVGQVGRGKAEDKPFEDALAAAAASGEVVLSFRAMSREEATMVDLVCPTRSGMAPDMGYQAHTQRRASKPKAPTPAPDEALAMAQDAAEAATDHLDGRDVPLRAPRKEDGRGAGGGTPAKATTTTTKATTATTAKAMTKATATVAVKAARKVKSTSVLPRVLRAATKAASKTAASMMPTGADPLHYKAYQKLLGVTRLYLLHLKRVARRTTGGAPRTAFEREWELLDDLHEILLIGDSVDVDIAGKRWAAASRKGTLARAVEIAGARRADVDKHLTVVRLAETKAEEKATIGGGGQRQQRYEAREAREALKAARTERENAEAARAVADTALKAAQAALASDGQVAPKGSEHAAGCTCDSCRSFGNCIGEVASDDGSVSETEFC